MNTVTKRACKVVSLYISYLVAALGVIFVGSIVSNRGNINCNPTVHHVTQHYLILTPNLDIRKSMNYNIKEVYVYLVHQIENNEKMNEQTVWSTLVKKNNTSSFTKPIDIFNPNRNRFFTKGVFSLKATYFPYVGVVKNKTLKVFTAASAK